MYASEFHPSSRLHCPVLHKHGKLTDVVVLQDLAPLHLAATPEIAHKLISHDANVNDKDKLVSLVSCGPMTPWTGRTS